MNDNVTTFLANLKHDIRNHQSVEVGSGIFKGQELVDVANTLAAAPDLLEALEAVIADDAESMHEFGISQHVIQKARTAIARAKGEAA